MTLYPAPPRRRGRESHGTLGTVAEVSADKSTATVDVPTGRIRVRLPASHRSARVEDMVRVSGAEVTEVVTPLVPETYTPAPGASTARSMSTAPPAAVSGSVGTVGTTVASTSISAATGSINGSTYDLDTALTLAAMQTQLNRLVDIVGDLRMLNVGPAGSTGLKAALNGAATVVESIKTATNTQSTTLGQVRSYADTLTADLKEQGITDR